MKRTLTLKSETLTDLSTDQLTAVVGGYALPTTPLRDCLDTWQPTRCMCP